MTTHANKPRDIRRDFGWVLLPLLCVTGCSLLLDVDELSNQNTLVATSAGSAGMSGSAGESSAGQSLTRVPRDGHPAPFQLSPSAAPDDFVAGGAAGVSGQSSAGRAGENTAGGGSGGQTFVYEAESMLHMIGRAEGDGWSASIAMDQQPGYLVYGPSPAQTWVGKEVRVTFRMMIDDTVRDDAIVAALSLRNANLDVPLVVKDVHRQEFTKPLDYQEISLPWTELSGHTGQPLECQVFWTKVAYLRVDKIVVTTR